MDNYATNSRSFNRDSLTVLAKDSISAFIEFWSKVCETRWEELEIMEKMNEAFSSRDHDLWLKLFNLNKDVQVKEQENLSQLFSQMKLFLISDTVHTNNNSQINRRDYNSQMSNDSTYNYYSSQMTDDSVLNYNSQMKNNSVHNCNSQMDNGVYEYYNNEANNVTQKDSSKEINDEISDNEEASYGMSETIQNWFLGNKSSATSERNTKNREPKHEPSIKKQNDSDATKFADENKASGSGSKHLGSRRESNMNQKSSVAMKKKSKEQIRKIQEEMPQSAMNLFFRDPDSATQDRNQLKLKFKQMRIEKRPADSGTLNVNRLNSFERSSSSKIKDEHSSARIKRRNKEPDTTILSQLQLLLNNKPSKESAEKKDVTNRNQSRRGLRGISGSGLLQDLKGKYKDKEVVRLYSAPTQSVDYESVSSNFYEDDTEEEEEEEYHQPLLPPHKVKITNVLKTHIRPHNMKDTRKANIARRAKQAAGRLK